MSHRSDALAEQNTCTRFCEFRHVFGNAWECMTHQQMHICDENCKQRIPATSSTSMCRLSKKFFTDRDPSSGMNVDTVKRKTEAGEWRVGIKRVDSGRS